MAACWKRALKNVAQLLTDAFGPLGAIAATIDASTITAYPTDPAAQPQGHDEWTPAAQGWSHPLHSQLLPRSTSAHHHVVAGITSRNEVLVVNLAAAGYLGIEGGNAVLMMRSWLMQTLSKSPRRYSPSQTPPWRSLAPSACCSSRAPTQPHPPYR